MRHGCSKCSVVWSEMSPSGAKAAYDAPASPQGRTVARPPYWIAGGRWLSASWDAGAGAAHGGGGAAGAGTPTAFAAHSLAQCSRQ